MTPKQAKDHRGRPVLVSFLIPCLDEERTIGQCILEARRQAEMAQADNSDLDYEIVVADNGSKDKSVEISTKMGARVAHVAKKGYGHALQGGIAESKGDYIIMFDGDLSYDLGCTGEIIKKLQGGTDMVIGDRFRGGIEDGAMPFLHKYLGNPVLSFLGRLFFGIKVRDFHCGLRGFRREKIIDLDLCSGGMEMASEMVVKAADGGLRIEEVPCRLRKDKRDRPPHLRTWTDGWRHLQFLLIHSPRWLFFIPGLFFVLAGANGLVVGGGVAFEYWGAGAGQSSYFSGAMELSAVLLIAMTVTLFAAGMQLIMSGYIASAYLFSHRMLSSKTNFIKMQRAGRVIAAGVALSLAGLLAIVWGIFTKEESALALLAIVLGIGGFGVGASVTGGGFLLELVKRGMGRSEGDKTP